MPYQYCSHLVVSYGHGSQHSGSKARTGSYLGRIIALALVGTIVEMVISLVVGVNYKIAIGGAL